MSRNNILFAKLRDVAKPGTQVMRGHPWALNWRDTRGVFHIVGAAPEFYSRLARGVDLQRYLTYDSCAEDIIYIGRLVERDGMLSGSRAPWQSSDVHEQLPGQTDKLFREARKVKLLYYGDENISAREIAEWRMNQDIAAYRAKQALQVCEEESLLREAVVPAPAKAALQEQRCNNCGIVKAEATGFGYRYHSGRRIRFLWCYDCRQEDEAKRARRKREAREIQVEGKGIIATAMGENIELYEELESALKLDPLNEKSAVSPKASRKSSKVEFAAALDAARVVAEAKAAVARAHENFGINLTIAHGIHPVVAMNAPPKKAECELPAEATCKHCGKTSTNVKEDFGYRVSKGKYTYAQAWCRKCRNTGKNGGFKSIQLPLHTVQIITKTLVAVTGDDKIKFDCVEVKGERVLHIKTKAPVPSRLTLEDTVYKVSVVHDMTGLGLEKLL